MQVMDECNHCTILYQASNSDSNHLFTHAPCGSVGQQTDIFFFFFSFSTPQTFCFS